MPEMNTTESTTTTAAAPVEVKPKRKRAPRTKPAPALMLAPEPVPNVPDRSLEDLIGVDFTEMTNGELVASAAEMTSRIERLINILKDKDLEIRRLNEAVSRHQAYAGYVRETINHARNSLFLQADALGTTPTAR